MSNVITQKEKRGKESKKRSLVVDDNVQQAKRAKSPGIRLIGSRIYDSENGKTCHQCRQKTRDYAASCKNRKGKKPCMMKFCHKCLLNRYGENAEKVELLDDWDCPKCRGVCNCSFCMKKRGHQPTGIMIHAAKSTGFNSVSEMLQVNSNDNVDTEQNSPQKQALGNKETIVISPRKRGKENSLDGSRDTNLSSMNCSKISNEKKHKQAKREGLKELYNDNSVNAEFSRRSSPRKIQPSEEICEKVRRSSPGKIQPGKIQPSEEICEKVRRSSPRKIQPSEKICEKINKANCKDKGTLTKKKTLSGKICEEVKNANCRGNGASIGKTKLITSEELSSSSKARHSKEKNGVSQKYGRVPNSLEKENIVLKDHSAIPFKAEGADKEKDCKRQIEAKVSNGMKNNKDIPTGQRLRKCAMEIQNMKFADVSLPLGASLTSIAGIELPIQDIGQALQFLEFCAVFGKVLNLKKGYGESLLRELMRERRSCRVQGNLPVRFQIQILSLILKNIGEEYSFSCSTDEKSSWFKALQKCLAASSWALNELPSDYFDRGGDCYEKLSLSTKLRLLNFLCDEALSTVELRNWIEDQNSNFVKSQKEAREKVVFLKDKEKVLKQKLQDEFVKRLMSENSASLSISEYDSIVSRIKSEANRVKSEKLSAMGMVPKKRQRSDAVRTDPMYLDLDGRAFWKLRAFNGEECILLQDAGTWGAVASEKWFMYKAEQKQEVLKYISSLSLRKLEMKNIAPILTGNSSESTS